MKIALAQINPKKGAIESNIKLHEEIIALAVKEKVNAIFFSELSITGYEPKLAKKLSFEIDDERLNTIKELSKKNNLIIAIGLPLRKLNGLEISMLIIYPNSKRQIYSKQILHEDEKSYFKEGDAQTIIESGIDKFAPAICYESLQVNHLNAAKKLGATIYLASVAKSQEAVEKAYEYFPKVAKSNSIPILMSNSIGYSDNFLCAGQSAIWNKNGNLIAQLDKNSEGILIFDTENETAKNIKRETRP